MDSRSETAVGWLLESREPAVRLLTRRDVLGENATEDVLRGPKVRALLSSLGRDVHPYHKWVDAYWRMIALVDFGVPAEPGVLAGLDQVLTWRQRSRPYEGHRRSGAHLRVDGRQRPGHVLPIGPSR